MLILGVDPGTIRCGYGVIDFVNGKPAARVDSGVILLQRFDNIPDKLEKIYSVLTKLIKQHHPEELSIETAFYGKNVQSALKIGLARGAAILAAKNNKLLVSEYSPREIKKAITGNGTASKEQVLFMVQTLLNEKKTKFSPDESDALGTALCHGFRLKTVSAKPKNWQDFIQNFPERIIG
jgi:crossover junction endodeoxyribonuclease RuvC